MTEKESDLVKKETKMFCSRLREMGVDAVQVLVTWGVDASNVTVAYMWGMGNWYARVGLAHEFVTQDEATASAEKIGEKFYEIVKDDDDDNESWKEEE